MLGKNVSSSYAKGLDHREETLDLQSESLIARVEKAEL